MCRALKINDIIIFIQLRKMINLASIRSTSIIKITTNSSHFNKA
nr:MAG TPA: hypothetical protein [Caudoviricetes sp.]